MEALKIPNLSIFVSVIDGLDTPINSSTAIGSPRGSIRWFENLPNNLDGRFGDGFFTDEKPQGIRITIFFKQNTPTIFWGYKIVGSLFFPKHLRVCKLAFRISIECHTSFQGTKRAIATVEVHRKYVFFKGTGVVVAQLVGPSKKYLYNKIYLISKKVPKVGWWLRYGGDFSLVLVIFCKYKFLFLGGEIWKFPG